MLTQFKLSQSFYLYQIIITPNTLWLIRRGTFFFLLSFILFALKELSGKKKNREYLFLLVKVKIALQTNKKYPGKRF